ncbi:MAG: SDR family NAD(P)-dependent oxidoreductase [Capsulimonadales bacterium]|nr:SDR family NAD(P)-dependent oxidoreductase [Capsulimonadales bacterium]
MEIDLRGKVALVTGAGRGIGNEILTTLAREGVKVVATDVRQDLLDALTSEFTAQGWEGLARKVDVRDATAIASLVEEVVSTYGRIDILVNNAGVAVGTYVEELTEEAWDANQDINLKGTFLMCRAVLPTMKQQRSGRILNAASFAAIVPSLGSAAYASSKAGVHYFTRVLAGEVGPWNITVNCYSPGMIPTEMNHFTERAPETQSRLLDTLTLRRWQEAKEVANLICFLSSDLAGYITGTMIDISGGKLATQIPRMAYERAATQGEYEFE